MLLRSTDSSHLQALPARNDRSLRSPEHGRSTQVQWVIRPNLSHESKVMNTKSTISPVESIADIGFPSPEKLIEIEAEIARHAIAYLAEVTGQGIVTPTPFEAAAADVFLSMVLEGKAFTAIVGQDGELHLTCDSGDAPIGASSIYWSGDKQQYNVCKYDQSQQRISLAGLTPAAVRTLCVTFGLGIYFGPAACSIPGVTADQLFYGSTAHTALKTWARAHPRLVKRLNSSKYLAGIAESLQVSASSPH